MFHIPSPDFDPEDIPYFFDNWLSLPWSPWVPFTADKQEFQQIAKEPGLYRIRPVNKDFLMYIGETSRTLHERLNELRHNIRRTDLMPWNDPHTAAPSLWAWNNAEHYEYECSASPLDASASGRKGIWSHPAYANRCIFVRNNRELICVPLGK